MCVICVELMKQRMTLAEAERNSREMIATGKPGEDVSHYRDLNRAVSEGDLEALADILDESDAETEGS